MPTLEDLRLDAGGSDVTARAHRPEGRPRKVAVALAHGAGSDLDAKGLTALAEGLARCGHLAVRFNLPYREAGRRAPPRAEASVAAYRAIFEDAARRLGPRLRWVAGGRSYGGRVASLAVAEGMRAAGLLLASYPLHRPGDAGRTRDAHWPRVLVPCLFLRGTADPMCEPAAFARALPALEGRATDLPVEGGDHSLLVPARASADGRRRTEERAHAEAAEAIAGWLAGLTP